jgi:hypothetical protein
VSNKITVSNEHVKLGKRFQFCKEEVGICDENPKKTEKYPKT